MSTRSMKEHPMICARLLMLAGAVLSAGCGRTAPPGELSASDIAAIRATTERWVTGIRTGRWEDVAATFTEDAVLQFPGARYEGRPAILKWLHTTQPWSSARELHIDEIRGRGDMAFVMGHSTVTPEDGGSPIVVGRYLDIRLRQADGTWLFYRDMVTPVPQPAPKD
ncbi:MAG: SgcJ/EcaC family oxidoreductase [Gemmatimonadales bacterium]